MLGVALVLAACGNAFKVMNCREDCRFQESQIEVGPLTFRLAYGKRQQNATVSSGSNGCSGRLLLAALMLCLGVHSGSELEMMVELASVDFGRASVATIASRCIIHNRILSARGMIRSICKGMIQWHWRRD